MGIDQCIVEWSLVLRSTLEKPFSVAGRIVNFTGFSVLAVSALTLQTTSISYQDIPGLLGQKAVNRWLMHIEQQPGQSVAEIVNKDDGKRFVDPTVTTSISASLSVSEKIVSSARPEKVNRAIKGDRVVATTAKKAPKNFSAGSILERHSILQNLESGAKLALNFVKPKPHKEAFQVASLFHPAKPKGVVVPKNLPVAVANLVKQSESSVLAYSPEPEVEYSPFSAVLVEEQQVKILPKLNKGDHAWADDPLPKSSYSKRQQQCLAQGIYFEARGEPVKGQAAVSQVILNRVRNPHYPNSICGVVYQNKHWYNRCQFSFACDRVRDRIRNKKLYRVAKHVAAETTAGRIWLPQVGSSTHYHATYVNPRWNRKMKRVGKIGLHIFYRTIGGGWS